MILFRIGIGNQNNIKQERIENHQQVGTEKQNSDGLAWIGSAYIHIEIDRSVIHSIDSIHSLSSKIH